MKTTPSRRWNAGYVSTLLVLSTGSVLTLLTVVAYKRSMNSRGTQAQVQLKLDYSEKEESILRAIVAITPNRAIRAMKSGSSSSTTVSRPLRWRNIFTESLDLANTRTSIPSNLLVSLGLTDVRQGNSGDSTFIAPDRIFHQIGGVDDDLDTSYASAGINRSLGTGFPVPLTTANSTTIDRDRIYPIISRDKQYGSLAQSGVGLPVTTYPDFNLLTYPNINFGYARPGDPFVAKRNWWAFSMDVADHDDDKTLIAHGRRDFVLSIYEVPSQLAISASSFMSLGQYSSGSAWQNVTIEGGVFAGKAEVLGDTAINALSSRRGMTLSSGTTLGGQSFANSPFTPGVREAYQVTTGAFFPASLASESGRSAFVPINRGAEFFDRFAHAAESSVLSPTTWNNYSIGALQCAMQLDVTKVSSATDPTPKEFRFSFLKNNARNAINDLVVVPDDCPPGYAPFWNENASYNFGTEVVDVAYGKNGAYAFKNGVSGSISFNNATFGDPLVGTGKKGYLKIPFERTTLAGGQTCVAIYPQRMKVFLTVLGADSAAVNSSLVVNVNYSNIGATYPKKPYIPCTNIDYGLILKECANLTSFPKGFSLVTNLRLYIGDDFNTTAATPPTGYPSGSTFYPPCSLFAPEKRYGVEVDPFAVVLAGQIGSLASDSVSTAVRPLDSKNMSGVAMAPSQITVNLRPIIHPAALPPITMMNWLVVLEERR